MYSGFKFVSIRCAGEVPSLCLILLKSVWIFTAWQEAEWDDDQERGEGGGVGHYARNSHSHLAKSVSRTSRNHSCEMIVRANVVTVPTAPSPSPV